MIVLVAYFSVKPENVERTIELSRQEVGCRSYIAHQQANDPLRFCFYEAYDDERAIELHRGSSHYQQFVVDGLFQLIDNPTRERYRPITASPSA